MHKSIDSPDNPWSKPSFGYSLNCSKCEAEWTFSPSSGTMKNKASLEPYTAARKEGHQASEKMYALAKALSKKHLEALTFPSKKSEHAYLVEIGQYSGGYPSYLNRRKVLAFSDMASADPHSPFIMKLAKSSKTADEILSLSKQKAATELKAKHAESLIQTKHY